MAGRAGPQYVDNPGNAGMTQKGLVRRSDQTGNNECQDHKSYCPSRRNFPRILTRCYDGTKAGGRWKTLLLYTKKLELWNMFLAMIRFFSYSSMMQEFSEWNWMMETVGAYGISKKRGKKEEGCHKLTEGRDDGVRITQRGNGGPEYSRGDFLSEVGVLQLL